MSPDNLLFLWAADRCVHFDVFIHYALTIAVAQTYTDLRQLRVANVVSAILSD